MAVALLLSALLFMHITAYASFIVICAIAEFLLGCLAAVYIIPFPIACRRVPMKPVEQQWNDEYVIDCDRRAFAAAHDRPHRSWLYGCCLYH